METVTHEGWLYLAASTNLASGFAIGWAIVGDTRDDLTFDAFGHALAWRQNDKSLDLQIHHSDQGSQCPSDDYSRVFAELGIGSNLSERGESWENAVVKSVFVTIKKELI
jgi:putative transposase